MKCGVEICTRDVQVQKHGLCKAHFERLRRRGALRPEVPLQVKTPREPEPPTLKRFKEPGRCARGHISTGPGCRICQNLFSALTKIHNSGGRVTARRLYPYGDRDHLATCWANRYEVSMDAAYRATDRLRHTVRITVGTADRWCTALGLHLCLLYPELYMDVTYVEESA
jgi:hypothetical protein